MQHRDKVKEMLTQFVPEYDKAVKYLDYAQGYEQAVIRARRLAEQAEQIGESWKKNPTTGVYRLTESIRLDRLDPTID